MRRPVHPPPAGDRSDLGSHIARWLAPRFPGRGSHPPHAQAGDHRTVDLRLPRLCLADVIYTGAAELPERGWLRLRGLLARRYLPSLPYAARNVWLIHLLAGVRPCLQPRPLASVLAVFHRLG